MPSPFPGMDPYIDDPELWPAFHNSLASEIRAELNKSIQLFMNEALMPLRLITASRPLHLHSPRKKLSG